MVRCSECGREVPDDVKFCSHCGSRLEEIEIQKETNNNCDNCGSENPDTSKFCSECGETIKQPKSIVDVDHEEYHLRKNKSLASSIISIGLVIISMSLILLVILVFQSNVVNYSFSEGGDFYTLEHNQPAQLSILILMIGCIMLFIGGISSLSVEASISNKLKEDFRMKKKKL